MPPTLAGLDDLNQFSAFLLEDGFSNRDANQCEITYVNHLPAGEEWSRHGEVGNVVGPLPGRTSDDFLPEPESVEAPFRYVFRWPGSEEPAGRLHVQVGSVHRVADGPPMLKVLLTARGRPRGAGTDDVLEWLDVGHDFLVRGFASLTTENMHRRWGRNGRVLTPLRSRIPRGGPDGPAPVCRRPRPSYRGPSGSVRAVPRPRRELELLPSPPHRREPHHGFRPSSPRLRAGCSSSGTRQTKTLRSKYGPSVATACTTARAATRTSSTSAMT